MTKKTIADHMRDVLNENNEHDVDIGRPWLWVECLERSKMSASGKSYRLGYRVMDALERSDMFEKRIIMYTRRVRNFILKEEYRIKS